VIDFISEIEPLSTEEAGNRAGGAEIVAHFQGLSVIGPTVERG
jgi:hypothetical protein